MTDPAFRRILSWLVLGAVILVVMQVWKWLNP